MAEMHLSRATQPLEPPFVLFLKSAGFPGTYMILSIRAVAIAGGACMTLAACATAPAPDAGFLSTYQGLEARTDTVRASVRQRRDEALAQAVEKVRIEPAVLAGEAADAPGLSPKERALVLAEIDRQVCYEISERFTVVEQDGPDTGRIRLAASRISPTGQAGSVASAAANILIPGPVGVRAPGTTGGLAAEAELLTADGRQAAAIVWARNATVVGTDNPSLSRIGDAHALAEVFGDMVGDAFAPQDRAVRPIAEPDPCARFGPRNRPEGFVTRLATGLYSPELSGGRPAPETEP